MSVSLTQQQPLQRAQSIPNLIQEYGDTQLVGCSPRRIADVKTTLLRWVAYMKNRQMEPMSLAHWPAYLVKKGVHPNSVNAHVRILKAFLRWCFRIGAAKERWYEFIPSVRGVAASEPKIITQTEYEKLLSSSTDRDLSWGLICAYHTGLRLGDVCNLRWSSVDMVQQFVRTTPHKTGRAHGISAEIPIITGSDMHSWLIELSQESECRPDDYVSYSLHVRYALDPTCISRYYKRLFVRAGIPEKSYKHFRSTFESRMANSGMNLGIAAKITGRADPKSLMRYLKVDPRAAREGVAKALELHNTHESFK